MNGLFICICTWPRVEMFTTAGVTRLIMGARVGTAWPDTTGGSTWARAGKEAKLEAASTAAKTMRFIGYVLLSLYMSGRWGFGLGPLPKRMSLDLSVLACDRNRVAPRTHVMRPLASLLLRRRSSPHINVGAFAAL